MDLKDHLTVLAALARGSVGEACLHLGTSPAVADTFRAFMAHHQLLGNAAHVLKDHPLREEMPLPLLADLAIHTKKLGWKNDKVRTALPAVAAAFKQANVSFIVLKGLHLALRFYGGMERRTFWDMDLLVHPADLTLAHEQLAALGYAKASRVLINERVSRYFTHAYDFRKPEAVDIDLHWKLANHPGLRLNYEAIWESKQTLEFEGTTFSTLSDTYALAFLLIGIVKDIERGSLRMRSMVDMYTLLQVLDAETDWSLFFKDRKEEGIVTLCVEALAVFFVLFQVRPEEFPRLQKAISSQAGPLPGQEEVMALFQPQRFAMKNKWWASRLYATSRPGYMWWWGFSLPARLMIHKQARKTHKKKKAGTSSSLNPT